MRFDKSEILRDAHLRYRQGLRLNMGWSFSRCLATAWQAAKMRQAQVAAFRTAPRQQRAQKPFPLAA